MLSLEIQVSKELGASSFKLCLFLERVTGLRMNDSWNKLEKSGRSQKPSLEVTHGSPFHFSLENLRRDATIALCF